MKATQLVLFLLLSSLLQGQCPDLQGVPLFFNSQDDVEDFIQTWPNCTDLTGDVIIGRAANGIPGTVESLEGLSGLRGIDGVVRIIGNTRLVNLKGLDSLNVISKEFYIEDNSSLESIAEINQLECHLIEVKNCPKLSSFNYEGDAETVKLEGPLSIEQLNFDRKGRTVSLVLFNLKSLDTVRVGQGTYNHILVKDCSIKALIHEDLGPDQINSLLLWDCPELGHVTILDGHKEISDGLVLTGLNFKTFDFLKDLSKVNSMRIEACAELMELGILNEVEVSGLINIFNNERLESIDGLKKTFDVARTVAIQNNSNLSMCEALCNRLEKDSLETNIQNNALGCSSEQEILSGCTTASISLPRSSVRLNRWDGRLIINNLGEPCFLELIRHDGHRVLKRVLSSGQHEIKLEVNTTYIVILRYKDETVISRI